MTSAALLAHLAGPVLTLATLVTITRRDGAVFGFTDHDQPLQYAGRSYLPGTYTPSAIVSGSDISVDNMEITGLIDGAIITRPDLLAGMWRGARVVVDQVNYRDLSQGVRTLRTGFIGEVSLGEAAFRAELRGLAQLLQQSVGELSSAYCRADLGDSRCKVNVADLSVSGVVEAIDPDNCTISDSARTEPGPAAPIAITAIGQSQYAPITAAGHGLRVGQITMISDVVGMTATELVSGQRVSGMASINGTFAVVRTVIDSNRITISLDTRDFSSYVSGGKLSLPGNVGTFDGGNMLFTSGTNAGRVIEVKAYVPGLIVLASPMPYPIAVGDTYTLTPGCGKRILEDCAGRYSNAINFRGEPYRPGMDAIVKAAGA